MKKLSALILLTLFGFAGLAQAPEKINYQCVVRTINGISVTNQLVGVRVAILQGSSVGPEVFAETHGPTTNDYGLINIQIGTGSNTGPQLNTINWGSNNFYLKVEIDPTGGTSYSVSSTTQLVSVPFALYAKTAGNVNDADADPTNEYNTGVIVNGTDLEITDGGGTITADLTSVMQDPDMDPSNEIQVLQKVGNIITLSPSGGAVTDDVNDADPDPTNEYNTTFTLVGTTLQLTDNGGTLNADLTALVNDADPDPTNEYNTGALLIGNNLTITDGGGTMVVDLSSIAGGNPTDELNTNVQLVGTTLAVTDPGGTLTADLSSLVNDADADPSNELQTINQVGSNVTLSNGGGTFSINDNDADATNEFNTSANLTGTNLNITDGGGTFTVDLSSLQDGFTDADADPTNEYNTSVVLNGTNLEVTDGGGTIITDLSALGGAGNPTDELNQVFFLDGDTIKMTDAGGTLGVDLSPLITGGGDLSTTNELNTSVVLNGTNLEVTDPGGTLITDLSSLVNDADADPTNEYNTSVVLNGTNLEVTDGGGTIITDLSSLGGAGNPTDELNTSVILNGTNLEVTDAGGTIITDLSSLQDGVTDADADPANEFNTSVVLNGTNLEVTDGGGTIITDLSSLGGGGNPTDELNSTLVLNGTTLELTDAGGTLTADLSSLSGGSSGIKVGQFYQGGIVVFVDSTGIHGLIIGTADIGTGVQFEDPGGAGPGGNALNTLATSFYDGAANTAALAGHADIYIAADLCDSYSAGGFSDWYLPSAFEMELVFQSNYVMSAYGFSLPMTTYYWTSTQDAASAGFNSFRCRSHTLFLETTSELNTANVRPMRAF